MSETQQYKLKAMAKNYAGGHRWDHLDSDTCSKAAEEIGTLRTANQRLEGEVARLTVSNANQTVRRFVGDDDQRQMDELVAIGIRADQQEIKRLREAVREFAGFFSSDDPKHWELHGLADGAVLKVMQARKLLPKCEPSPDAELVELLRSKFPRIDPCQPVPLDEKAHCCEYTIYVERERLHRMIDAKLASLKGEP